MPPLTRRGFLAGGAALAVSPAFVADARAASAASRDPRLLVLGADALPPGWLARLAAMGDPASPWPHRLLGIGRTMPPSLGVDAALCCRQSLHLLPPARLAALLSLAPGRRPARVVAARMPGALRDGESDEALATMLGRLLAEPAGPRIVALPMGRDGTGSHLAMPGPAPARHEVDRRSSFLTALDVGLGGCRHETLIVSALQAPDRLTLFGDARQPGDDDAAETLARHFGMPRESVLAALAAPVEAS